MLAVIDAFLQSEALTYAVAAIALLAGAHLLLLMFRRAFLRRLRVPARGAGYGHAERLGIVKSLALDRRRQLLAVHSDNVEHLIMIGGPSDLVIETDFTATSGHDPYEIGESWPGDAAPVTARFGWIGSYIQPASRIFIGPGLFQLAVVSGIAGAGTGLICGLFRRALETVDRFRISLPVVWHGEPLLGCSLLIAGAAVAAAFSAWLVRRF